MNQKCGKWCVFVLTREVYNDDNFYIVSYKQDMRKSLVQKNHTWT